MGQALDTGTVGRAKSTVLLPHSTFPAAVVRAAPHRSATAARASTGMRTEQTRRGEGPCRTRACQFGRSRRASGMPRIFLQVEDNNEAALALYRRAGFETLWGMSTGADSFRPATSAAAHVER